VKPARPFPLEQGRWSSQNRRHTCFTLPYRASTCSFHEAEAICQPPPFRPYISGNVLCDTISTRRPYLHAPPIDPCSSQLYVSVSAAAHLTRPINNFRVPGDVETNIGLLVDAASVRIASVVGARLSPWSPTSSLLLRIDGCIIQIRRQINHIPVVLISRPEMRRDALAVFSHKCQRKPITVYHRLHACCARICAEHFCQQSTDRKHFFDATVLQRKAVFLWR